MIIALDDRIAYLLAGIFALLLLFAIMVRRTSWAYVYPRIHQAIRGGMFALSIDKDNNLTFERLQSGIDGSIETKDRLHQIKRNSGLKNPDGTIYLIHKNMTDVLTPKFILAANNLEGMGFKSISHALAFYKSEYFKDELLEIKNATNEKTKNELIDKFEKKAGLKLMAPIPEDNFTLNLAICADFNNQDLNAYGIRNVANKIKNEANRENIAAMLNPPWMQYAIAIAIVMCATVFALKMAGNI